MFYVGAPLDPDLHERLYVVRDEDRDVRRSLARTGNECALVSLIGARQTGKTSLLNRLHRDLAAESSWVLLQLDLRTWNALQGAQWYQRLVTECQRALQPHLPELTIEPLQQHCAQQFIASPFSPQGWTELVYLACEQLPANRRLLVSLDSINRMPHEEWGPLFSQIRTIYEASRSPVNARRTAYRKFGMTLAGAFDPNQLITDDNSPFNVGARVYMSPVVVDQLAQLADVLAEEGIVIEEGARRAIHCWSGGIPYYVQYFCAEIEQAGRSPVTEAMVDELADLVQLNDMYLGFALRRLAEEARLARYVERILDRPVQLNRTAQEIAALEIAGVIRFDPASRKWCIANRLYERALREHFGAGGGRAAPAAVLKPAVAGSLRRAVETLFDEGGGVAGGYRQDDVLGWQPVADNLEDLVGDIDQALRLIAIYQRNRQALDLTIASYGGRDRAPIADRNQLDATDSSLHEQYANLRALLGKAYGRQLGL
jgi:hypothetical protein